MSKETKAMFGAGLGAVLGAVIGHQSGEAASGALLGAGLGAGAGYGIGYVQEQQRIKREQELVAREMAYQKELAENS